MIFCYFILGIGSNTKFQVPWHICQNRSTAQLNLNRQKRNIPRLFFVPFFLAIAISPSIFFSRKSDFFWSISSVSRSRCIASWGVGALSPFFPNTFAKRLIVVDDGGGCRGWSASLNRWQRTVRRDRRRQSQTLPNVRKIQSLSFPDKQISRELPRSDFREQSNVRRAIL